MTNSALEAYEWPPNDNKFHLEETNLNIDSPQSAKFNSIGDDNDLPHNSSLTN